MTVKAEWLQDNEQSSIVEIKIRSSQIMAVRNTLHLLGVPELTPGRHGGYIIAQGSVSIYGTHSACEEASQAILIRLNGPPWMTGAEILARNRKGALL
jgi:hypothetical protein